MAFSQVAPWPQPQHVYTVELFTSAATRSGIMGPAWVEFHGRTGCTGRHHLESPTGGFVTGSVEACSFQANDCGQLVNMLISHDDIGALAYAQCWMQRCWAFTRHQGTYTNVLAARQAFELLICVCAQIQLHL